MAELNPEFNNEVDLSAASTAITQPDADPLAAEADAGSQDGNATDEIVDVLSEPSLTNENDVPAEHGDQFLKENGGTEGGEQPAPTPAQPAAKTPSRLQQRIDGLIADRVAAERQAGTIQKHYDNLVAALKGEKEPNEEDFEKYSDYVKALSRYTAKQEEITRVEKALEDTVEIGQKATLESHKARMYEGQEKFGEQFFKHVAPLADVFHSSSAAYHALFDSPEFANVANHLAHNITEAQRIAGLPASQQTREIIKLENRFAGVVADKPPTPPQVLPKPTPVGRVSQAPAPAPAKTVLSGKAPGSGKPNPAKESMDDYASRRQRELRKSGIY